jgi:hypothetical protein
MNRPGTSSRRLRFGLENEGEAMALSAAEQTKLDDYRFMMGDPAGSLALALEQLTDAMAAVGQHTVYCRVEKGPRAGEPPLDVAELLETLANAKALVQETMLKLRSDRSP